MPIADPDIVNMIHNLFNDKSNQIRLDKILGDRFLSIIGVLQGDSLSPILFIIYLQAALKNLNQFLKETLDTEYDLMGYADNYVFVCFLEGYQEGILKHAPAILD